MSRLILRCRMQDNGFKQSYQRELTIKECKELFDCSEYSCANCTMLQVVNNIKKRKRG